MKELTANDKWRMFKNYMHNELGITKDDIRMWIQESCVSVAEGLVAREFNDFDVEKVVKSIIMKGTYWGGPEIQKQIETALVKELAKHIEIKVTI